MEPAETYEDKLAYFSTKDLKDVLTDLGFPKEGKKQELVDRILDILSFDSVSWPGMKDEVANLVDDTFRKIKVSRASILASNSEATLDDLNVKLNEVVNILDQMAKIRCICGRTASSDPVIKCGDLSCGVWQHMACVLISENPLDGVIPSPPDVFYCELCRLSRADPFWANVSHPFRPVKLKLGRIPTDDDQSPERTFRLTRQEWGLLSKEEYEVQAWSVLLNDEVLFRIQWPQYTDLWINGVPVKVNIRPPGKLPGPSDRDDGILITPTMREGSNRLLLQAFDSRKFCVGVRLVKRRTLKQVLDMIQKEADGEPFEEALARVRRCLGGSSDSDVEVVADFLPLNLRCPISGVRMKVAARFKPCPHMACFDLQVLVEMNQETGKWQCPICVKNYSWADIVIDPYFNRITSKMRDLSADVSAIEVKNDGSWRAKSEGDGKELGELAMWHLPDCTICSAGSKAIVLSDSVGETEAEVNLNDSDDEINKQFDDKCRLGTETDA